MKKTALSKSGRKILGLNPTAEQKSVAEEIQRFINIIVTEKTGKTIEEIEQENEQPES